MTDTPDTTVHPTEWLAELALGALPPADEGRVRAHLETCASCREEYRVMASVARVLPLAGADTELSPALRENVMSRIAREPRPAGQSVLAVASRRRAWRWQPAAIAAGLVLLVAAGVGGFVLGHINGGGSASDTAQATLAAALANGTARTTHYQQGQLQMTFVRAPGASSGFLSASNLPALPAGKAYEAWFSKDGKHMEAATVFTSSGGAWIEAPGPLDQYAGVGFTIEDRAGASQPTTQPFALFDLRPAGGDYGA